MGTQKYTFRAPEQDKNIFGVFLLQEVTDFPKNRKKSYFTNLWMTTSFLIISVF